MTDLQSLETSSFQARTSDSRDWVDWVYGTDVHTLPRCAGFGHEGGLVSSMRRRAGGACRAAVFYGKGRAG